MSTLGLTTMLVTWAVVIFITARFFIKILQKPIEQNGEEG